jgi:hypothetical protein
MGKIPIFNAIVKFQLIIRTQKMGLRRLFLGIFIILVESACAQTISQIGEIWLPKLHVAYRSV